MGGYCLEDYLCKYNEIKDFCYCGVADCDDSDGGFDLAFRGTCNDSVSTNVDTCVYDGESVVEWFCGDAGCENTTRYCESGCEFWACK